MRFEPPSDAHSFDGPECDITVWYPAAGTVAARVRGHVSRSVAAATFADIDRHALEHGHPGRGFIDLSDVSGFDWAARLVLIRWNVAHRAQAVRLDVLSDHWVTASALRALATVLGGRLVVHGEAYTFEAAYFATVPQPT
jgi:hypothetical protein